MSADKSYSSLSRERKREKLMALIERRKTGVRTPPKNRDDMNSKNRVTESTKRKILSSHFYRKLFRISGQKVKMLNDVNDMIAKESCLGSSHKKQRLCSGQRSCESFQWSRTEHKIESDSGELADFEEYWVPVHLSSVQIEHYCSILSSNLESLSTASRNSLLHDIVSQIQKCCDHPYLVDPALADSLRTTSLLDSLDAQINVSGKMQLLDKLLLEIKRCGLRALVLFQSAVNSDKISTGHILEDLVHQRFGESSYVYIRGKVLRKAKRKETLAMFNSAESERFICLFDTACRSSLRHSRVDVVILFNSDVNPLNDIKALRRITIDSPCERLTVFRLYSTFTIEEKALIHAKQGTTVNYVKSSVYHQLLAWGASYLYSKLQSCTGSGPLSSIDDLDHLVNELSSLLRNKSVTTGPTNGSIISKAQMQNGAYSGCIVLYGENESHIKESSSVDKYLIDKTPSVFWCNLAKESQQRLENSHSRLTRRVQKSTGTCFDEIRNDTTTSFFVRRKLRSKREGRKQAGTNTPFGSHQGESQRESLSLNLTNARSARPPSASISDSVALTPRTNGGQQSQSDQLSHTSSSTPLEAEIERIQKEREQITKLHQEKKCMLLSECEKEISEIQKKYDAMIYGSEMSLAKEIKTLEDYQKLVDTNKLLAEILAQNWADNVNPNELELSLNQTKLNLNQRERNPRRKQKATHSFNIPNINASALARPKNPCLTLGPTTNLHGQCLAGLALRAPPPHLRSNPSTFASFQCLPMISMPILEPVHNWPNTGIPVLEPDSLCQPQTTFHGLTHGI